MKMSPVQINEVNATTFPTYAMSGRLAELLSSTDGSDLRCTAVTPGHLVLATNGGKYVHTFDAKRVRGGDQHFDAKSFGDDETNNESTNPALQTLRAAFQGDDTVDGDGAVSRKQEKTVWANSHAEDDSSFLCYFGDSPVASLLFSPEDGKNRNNKMSLAVTKNGAVAAWRWNDTYGDDTTHSADSMSTYATIDTHKECETSPPPPRMGSWSETTLPAFPGGPPFVCGPLDEAIIEKHGGVVEAVLCLVPDKSKSFRRRNSNPSVKKYKLRLACLTERGALLSRDVIIPKAESAFLLGWKFDVGVNSSVTVLSACVPFVCALYSSGGKDFWVVQGSEGNYGEGNCSYVATRWCASSSVATRRVDLGKLARAADEAVKAVSNYPDDVNTSTSTPSRLATCLHYPSNELLVVSDFGNVLAVGPGLSGPRGEDTNSEKEKDSVRHVGLLQNFAGTNLKFHVAQSCASVGPFLYLAQFFPSKSKGNTASNTSSNHKETPPRKTSISCYHLPTGIRIGTELLPQLRSPDDEVCELIEERNADEKTPFVRVTNSGPSGVFISAGDNNRASNIYSVSVDTPSASLSVLEVIKRKNETAGRRLEDDLDKLHALRDFTRQINFFGGSLQGVESASALSVLETEIDAAMRGGDEWSIQSTTNKNLPTRAQVTTPALVLRVKPPCSSTGNSTTTQSEKKWRLLALETVAFFGKRYPALGGACLSDSDAVDAFDTFTELGACEAKDVHRALGLDGVSLADTTETDTVDKVEPKNQDVESKLLRDGLALLKAAITNADDDAEGNNVLLQLVRCVKSGTSFSVGDRGIGGASSTTSDPSIDSLPEQDSLAEYESVCAFLKSASENVSVSVPKSSALEATAFRLADRIVNPEGTSSLDTVHTSFQAVCQCLHRSWPFIVPRVVSCCAAMATKRNLFLTLDDAVTSFAKHALSGIAAPLSSSGTEASTTCVTLLLFAKHEHAATWLALTRSAAVSNAKSDWTQTFSEGWLVAARLVQSSPNPSSSGKVFETMVHALKHVTRRDGLGIRDKTECSPETAAKCLLNAARGILETDSVKSKNKSIDSAPVSIVTLERLAEHSSLELGELTRAMECIGLKK